MRTKSGLGELIRLEIASVRANLLPMELQITVSGFISATQALPFIFMGRKA